MKSYYFHLLILMPFFVSSFALGMSESYDLKSKEILDSINTISNEYSKRFEIDRFTTFATNVSYLGIDGEIQNISKYTCSLGIPETNELNELRRYRPKNGLPLSYKNFDSAVMEKLKGMYTDWESSCSEKRDMYAILEKLINQSREEANFISIIKHDVFCRMFRNGKLDRGYIDEAMELVRNAHDADVSLRSDLLKYLSNLFLSNLENNRSYDEYNNSVWRTLISNISNSCEYGKSTDQSASEIAIRMQAMLESSYYSCEKGALSLASIQCHKKAIDFGGASLEKVMLLEEELKKSLKD